MIVVSLLYGSSKVNSKVRWHMAWMMGRIISSLGMQWLVFMNMLRWPWHVMVCVDVANGGVKCGLCHGSIGGEQKLGWTTFCCEMMWAWLCTMKWCILVCTVFGLVVCHEVVWIVLRYMVKLAWSCNIKSRLFCTVNWHGLCCASRCGIALYASVGFVVHHKVV